MRIGSLFAGLGGLDLACEWSLPGASTAWQLDQVGADVRRRHWPDAVQVAADVQTVDPLDLPAVDVLCGGFPCQDLSVAGKGAGLDGERSGLYREVLRFTAAIRSRYVVMENVPPLLKYMPRLCEDFRVLGYGLSWAVCEAADAGAPHLRRRVFVLAELDTEGRGLVEVDRSGRWRPETVERVWPTMTHKGNDNVAGLSPTSGDGLATAVHPWATLTASESKGRNVSLARREDPDMLSAQVRTWSTVAASNPNDGEDPASWHARRARLAGQGINGNGAGEPLGQQVLTHLWPTVTARDFKTGDINNRKGTPSLSQTCSDYPRGTWGRRLNPAWTERLMGLPEGWTLPTGPRLTAEHHPLQVRGRYPASWDRSIPWPGYEWEPSRTLPDGPPCPGRPTRIKALGNAVVPQQAALGLDALMSAATAQVPLFDGRSSSRSRTAGRRGACGFPGSRAGAATTCAPRGRSG